MATHQLSRQNVRLIRRKNMYLFPRTLKRFEDHCISRDAPITRSMLAAKSSSPSATRARAASLASFFRLGSLACQEIRRIGMGFGRHPESKGAYSGCRTALGSSTV